MFRRVHVPCSVPGDEDEDEGEGEGEDEEEKHIERSDAPALATLPPPRLCHLPYMVTEAEWCSVNIMHLDTFSFF